MKDLHKDHNEVGNMIQFTNMTKEEKLEYIKTYIIESEGYYYEYDEENDRVIKSIVGDKND